MCTFTKVTKNTLSQKQWTTICKIGQNFLSPAQFPSLFCGRCKRMTTVSYILRKFLPKNLVQIFVSSLNGDWTLLKINEIACDKKPTTNKNPVLRKWKCKCKLILKSLLTLALRPCYFSLVFINFQNFQIFLCCSNFNKNLEVSTQSSSSKQIKIFSKSFKKQQFHHQKMNA